MLVNQTEKYWDHVIWDDETKLSMFDSVSNKNASKRIEKVLHFDYITFTMKYPVIAIIRSSMISEIEGINRVIYGNCNVQKCVKKLETKLKGSICDLSHDNLVFLIQ